MLSGYEIVSFVRLLGSSVSKEHSVACFRVEGRWNTILVGLPSLPNQLKFSRTALFVGCYTASSGYSVLTFRDNLPDPSSGVNNPRTSYAAEVHVQPQLLGPQPQVLRYIVLSFSFG
jgi:hypothetical protein